MTIGDTVMRCPTFLTTDVAHKQIAAPDVNKPIPAKVVYVHPEGRFHVVEFTYRFGKFRESFMGVTP